jgi:hypothetical protein
MITDPQRVQIFEGGLPSPKGLTVLEDERDARAFLVGEEGRGEHLRMLAAMKNLRGIDWEEQTGPNPNGGNIPSYRKVWSWKDFDVSV